MTDTRVVPVEPTDEWFRRVVCLAKVWPMHDVDNVPSGLVDAVRCYHKAMLAAAPKERRVVQGRVVEREYDKVVPNRRQHIHEFKPYPTERLKMCGCGAVQLDSPVNAATRDRGTERLRERTSASNSSPVNAAPIVSFECAAHGIVNCEMCRTPISDNTTPSKLPLSEREIGAIVSAMPGNENSNLGKLFNQALAAISLEQRVKQLEGQPVPLSEWQKMEQRVADYDRDYQRIIREVLACNPLPASSREDDQIEPPWEVIKRTRERAEKAERELAAAQVQIKNQEAQITGHHKYTGQDYQFRIKHLEERLATARSDALEEAAKTFDGFSYGVYQHPSDRIRALKEKA